MKTSEFKKVVNNSDFCIQSGFDIPDDYTPNVISVKQNPLNQAFLTIDLNHIGDIFVRPDLYPSSNSLDIRKVKKVVQAGVQLAFTPIEEREDEPRFVVAVSPSYYKDESVWYLGSRKASYANETGKSIEWYGTEGACAHEFTPKSYAKFLKDYPEWRPFLPDYNADNTNIFVPVEVEK